MEQLVHNLEHGYTIVWYDNTIKGKQLDARSKDLAASARTHDAAGPTAQVHRVRVGRRLRHFPAGKHIGMSHWGAEDSHTQLCGKVSGDVGRDFIKKYPASRLTGAQRRLTRDPDETADSEVGLVGGEADGVRRDGASHQTRAPAASSLPAPTSAPSPTTTPSSTVPRTDHAHRAPTTEPRTARRHRPSAPSSRTLPSTRAPAPTTAPGADRRTAGHHGVGGDPRARQQQRLPDRAGQGGDASSPRTRSQDPRTNAAGVPRSSQ